MSEAILARLAALVLKAEEDKKRSIPVAAIAKILIEAHLTNQAAEPGNIMPMGGALHVAAGD